MKVQEREKQHFEELAEFYDRIYSYDCPTGQARIGRRASMMAETCRFTPNSRVLEIGCGTAALTEFLERRGVCLTAVDLSHSMIVHGKKKRSLSKTRFAAGNIVNLPFPDASFDAVVGTSILHHLDLPSSLKEILRVLRPGGRMAFSEPNYMNPHVFLERSTPSIRRMMHVSPDETAFLRWRVKRALKSAGFDEVTVIPFDFLAPYFPVRLIGTITAVGKILERTPLIKEISGSLFMMGIRPR